MANTISNQDDVIDSRDIIARLEYLESDRADLAEALAAAMAEYTEAADDNGVMEAQTARAAAAQALDAWDASDEGQELETLKALAGECEGYGDWEHGEALIRHSYFQVYAQELAEDLGCINPDAAWPNNCIDWLRAADELEQDYMIADFDGVEYLMRA